MPLFIHLNIDVSARSLSNKICSDTKVSSPMLHSYLWRDFQMGFFKWDFTNESFQWIINFNSIKTEGEREKRVRKILAVVRGEWGWGVRRLWVKDDLLWRIRKIYFKWKPKTGHHLWNCSQYQGPLPIFFVKYIKDFRPLCIFANEPHTHTNKKWKKNV